MVAAEKATAETENEAIKKEITLAKELEKAFPKSKAEQCNMTRLEIICKDADRNKVYDWLYEKRFRVVRGGPLVTEKSFPKIISGKQLIVAERKEKCRS